MYSLEFFIVQSKKEKEMRRPGFEPGSLGWQPSILTPILATLIV